MQYASKAIICIFGTGILFYAAVLTAQPADPDNPKFQKAVQANAENVNERYTQKKMKEITQKSFTFHPIGAFHSPLTRETGAPRQGRLAPEIEATIEIAPQYENCLKGIEHFSHIFVLFIFDRSKNWSANVHPPNAKQSRGLFSTRSPNRPNPIGLTAVRLVKREGRILHVSGIDAFDGTPVVDIKPYVGSIDSFPDAAKDVEEKLGLPRPEK
ncbi:tRNA (N6-threonylcarbamoyladenosine(37)-N6)-methyltransferase TrmO [bacterium]|nr:tRNA (N6-threonylcarbamoyladenosine(37)-N6)-methyltransferase TrmO [bacterium]